MDNLTHTLVGIVVGETAARTTSSAGTAIGEQRRRNMFVGLMALGSNLPDLDFLPSRFTGSKLEYLLHHRGHTHTILGAVLIAGLLFAAAEVWCRWKGAQPSRTDRLQLLGIALVAPLLHIALDYTNSYGVHPFWPFDNRWSFGDAVFIVEPLFWAACAPLVFLLRSKLAKTLAALALVAGIGLAFGSGLVPKAMCVTLLIFAVAMLLIGKLAPPRTALIASLVAWCAINGMFLASSAAAHRQAHFIASETFPRLAQLDYVLTPMPVNPLCWQLIFVQADAESWFLRRATLTLAPSWIAAQRCPSRSTNAATTAPMEPVAAPSTDRIAWLDEISLPRAMLVDWVAKDCRAAAFMRFARAPWLAQEDGRWVIGDARFDYERGLSFAEIELGAAGEPCMAYVPPWIPPREDLLK